VIAKSILKKMPQSAEETDKLFCHQKITALIVLCAKVFGGCGQATQRSAEAKEKQTTVNIQMSTDKGRSEFIYFTIGLSYLRLRVNYTPSRSDYTSFNVDYLS